MAWEDIIVLFISVLVSATITILYRIFKKQWFRGFQWMYGVLPLVAFIIVYNISDDYDIIENTIDMFIWTFILEMFIVNIKCIIRGSKRTVKQSKNFVSTTKESIREVKKTFSKSNRSSEAEDTKSDNSEDPHEQK